MSDDYQSDPENSTLPEDRQVAAHDQGFSAEASADQFSSIHQGQADYPVDKADDELTTEAKNALFSQMGPNAPTLPNYDELVEDRKKQIQNAIEATKQWP